LEAFQVEKKNSNVILYAIQKRRGFLQAIYVCHTDARMVRAQNIWNAATKIGPLNQLL